MATLAQYGTLVLSAFAAGAVNSIAGGGTLLTFPALLAVGVAPLTANATSTVALVPGSASAFFGYRAELRDDARTLLALGLPSVAGGILGARLALRAGDALFARLVPWLILCATVLFMAQEPLGRLLRARASSAQTEEASEQPRLWALALFQLLIAVYGGFFGAGIGILMLAALGLAGFRHVHRMNAMKNFAAVCINGVATVTFIAGRRVHWPFALVMATGAIAGGYFGAGVARRVGPRRVRQAVVAIGLGIAGLMFWRQYHGG